MSKEQIGQTPELNRFYWVRLNPDRPWTIGFVGDNFDNGNVYFNVPVLGSFSPDSVEWKPEPLVSPDDLTNDEEE